MEFPKISKAFLKKVKTEKYGRLKKSLLASVCVLIAVMFTRGEYGLLKIHRLHSKINTAKQDIVHLKVQAEDLNWEIKKLRNDSTYITLYAAEQFGYAWPNQSIIQFLPTPEDSTQ